MPVEPAPYNIKWDIKEKYVFYITAANDDESEMDVLSWSFEFILKDSNGNLIWDIINSDFTRPSVGSITFTKTVTDLSTLVLGLYSFKLLVTNTDAVDDVYMAGLYEFVDE